MSNKVTLGGDRLGAGKKQQVELHSYERSTHDLSYTWRSTMAAGTLVPFINTVALPGDTFDIDLNVDVKTHPTIGPLFGSYKVQLDVFSCPVRLYNGALHMNMLNIGLKMQDIKLPQIEMFADGTKTTDNGQINPSSLFSYLGIQGIGKGTTEAKRYFNAVPYLAYWDVYKQYYSNKIEEIGAYIHNNRRSINNSISTFRIYQGYDNNQYYITVTDTDNTQTINLFADYSFAVIEFTNTNEPRIDGIRLKVNDLGLIPLNQVFSSFDWNADTKVLTCSNSNPIFGNDTFIDRYAYNGTVTANSVDIPHVSTFDLKNIDDMRISILKATGTADPFLIHQGLKAPYGPPLKEGEEGYCKLSSQEGLGIKTYQSDLFNNWVDTEWIDGINGINNITAVDTTEGFFTIDTLQLSRKVYDMLNRIAVSGGTYDDWLNAVYTHERAKSIENPMYMGGLIKELAFQEVISNAASVTNDVKQPLGTLAGKGVLTKKHKGGKIRVKVDEPSVILGIVSLTPRIDYSQGNDWSVNLKTLDDFHKPALDEIGFQDLITDQMAWWSTEVNNLGDPTYKSAGKQPAWLNYMTNVNKCYGNFAIYGNQMWMTLNRRYTNDGAGNIKDMTTYIDPVLYNQVFSDSRIDAQNFWTQIAVDMIARRKMSAKLMPNL
jgi:hypothetical protein